MPACIICGDAPAEFPSRDPKFCLVCRLFRHDRVRLYLQRRKELDDREWLRRVFSKPKRSYGTHGGTLFRVLEARRLVQDGEPKTRACQRVGIDTRTFDRYLDEALSWSDEEKPEADLDD